MFFEPCHGLRDKGPYLTDSCHVANRLVEFHLGLLRFLSKLVGWPLAELPVQLDDVYVASTATPGLPPTLAPYSDVLENTQHLPAIAAIDLFRLLEARSRKCLWCTRRLYYFSPRCS